MATEPVLPAGESPLDKETVDLFLSNMGTDMVLVGGQALAFWMDRFGIVAEGAAISNDGDALGKVARAIELAETIKARVVLPKKSSMTAIVAQLRLPTAGGKERNIDVLHKLYAGANLKKSTLFTKRVIADSVEAEWRPGRFIRVMDPLDVLESRVQNAVGLFKEKGPHVLTQAQWAIQVASEALRRIAQDPKSTERLGGKIRRVYALARSGVGRRLLSERQMEILDAVDVEFLKSLSPVHSRQLDLVQKAKTERQVLRESGSPPPSALS
ncbi:hypothetical protein J2W39_003647 [Variovorax paradoxus]|uniref:Uncharacterized protein n=1 Tax=Variovorax paradoxus TaxID=34073 RepID=A0AAW8EHR4_VARPD|nr:hypothetical protein [Variovorax paradoxus]MDP9972405.1 hypothetical protein [Variovorax paradoxus]